jgi:hypothetical protein
MTFWRTLILTVARNPISLFAVLCVACTAGFLGWLTYRMLVVLESPAWCAKAIQAERMSAQNFGGLTACVDLLKIQLNAVSAGFHISTGGFVFVLVVLIVVVVAGAKASGKVGGMEFNVSRDAEQAAQHVVEGAEAAAQEVKGHA